jgi:hypothetical protein
VGPVIRSVMLSVGLLVALVVATAAAAVASTYGMLLAGPGGGGFYQYLRPDWVTILICCTLVAGAVFSLFLLGMRLPRTLLIGLGLLSLAMAAVAEYLNRRPDFQRYVGDGLVSLVHGETPSVGPTLAYLWLRYTAPTVAGALLAVAVILVAATRGMARSSDSSLYGTSYDAAHSTDPPGPASVPGGAFALLGGAVVWFALGLGEVALAAADGAAPLDFFGRRTSVDTVRFGSLLVLYVAAAAAVVLGAAIYTLLLSRHLHGSIPILIGVAYAGATTWYVALALARTSAAGNAPAPPALKLLAAVELAPQVPVTGAGLLLAVPLVVAGVRRIRQQRATRRLPALVADPSLNDPTLPLY